MMRTRSPWLLFLLAGCMSKEPEPGAFVEIATQLTPEEARGDASGAPDGSFREIGGTLDGLYADEVAHSSGGATATRTPSAEPKPTEPLFAADPAKPSPDTLRQLGALGYADDAGGADGTVAMSPPADRYDNDEEELLDGLFSAELTTETANVVGGAERERGESRQQAQKKAAVRWGETVYLSNDDSMSLASAQRVLWAEDKGMRVPPSQVRPHELLNYFSFDTVEPRGSDLFGVGVSAERVDGDTLALAIAVQGATPVRQPLDLTLVVDRSGSMAAEDRMSLVKRALISATDQLQPGDRVDLVLFDHRVATPIEGFTVGRDNGHRLTEAIRAIQPDGSTNLDAGLNEAYRLAREHATRGDGRNHRVMLFTDAELNTGNVDTHLIAGITSGYDDMGIRLTGVGVGKDFRDDVLDRLTEKGKGAYVYLGSEAVVDRLFGIGFPSLTQTIAHDVRFALELPQTLGMERFYGEESSYVASDIQPIHYYAGTSQVFLQDLAVAGGLSERDAVRLRVSWSDARDGVRREQVFATTVGEMLRADRHNVRKARALTAWSDMVMARALGADPCGDSFDSYRERLPGLDDDAEIRYVSSLVGRSCSFERPLASTVDYRVRLDSDVPISTLSLACGRQVVEHETVLGQNVTVFATRPGACTLTLQGPVAMNLPVDVPQSGADLRCVVRGGRVSCS